MIRRAASVVSAVGLFVTAFAGGYYAGRSAVAPPSSAPPTSPPAIAASPTVAPTQVVAPPLTPIALGTADLGTILFADGGATWEFMSATGQLRLRAFGPTPFSRGHAMSYDDGCCQAGFVDAREPKSALTPLSQRAVPLVSDLSPDGKRLAYVVNNKVRIYQQVFFNSTWTDLVPDQLFSSVRWSPSGRYLAAIGAPPVLDPAWPRGVQPNRGDVPGTVYLIDIVANTAKPLWLPDGTPRAPLPPARPPVEFVSWSPDEQYVLLRHQSVASGQDANGRDIFALEVATGKVTPLGIVVPTWSWITWRAPHTLAYVEGDRFEPWRNKRVRIWSPEDGFRDISTSREFAVSPTWDAEGRLFFVRGSVDAADPADTSRLVSFDPQTGRTTELLHDPFYAEVGARISNDGEALLVVRRRTDRPLLEMWTATLDGAKAHALWSYAPFWTVNDPYTRDHAIYQGAGVFSALAWSR